MCRVWYWRVEKLNGNANFTQLVEENVNLWYSVARELGMKDMELKIKQIKLIKSINFIVQNINLWYKIDKNM